MLQVIIEKKALISTKTLFIGKIPMSPRFNQSIRNSLVIKGVLHIQTLLLGSCTRTLNWKKANEKTQSAC